MTGNRAPEHGQVGLVLPHFRPAASEEIETSRLVHVKETFCAKVAAGDGDRAWHHGSGRRASMPLNAEDFDAGKSAPQLFASDCSSCHRTPYGLAKHMNNWSLDSFILREHYTASHTSADTLSAISLAWTAVRVTTGTSNQS